MSKVTSFLLVLSLVLVLLAPGILSRVAAQGSSPFHLSATITAVTQDNEFRFVPNFIPAGRGVIVNVTFVNNDTTGHSFTLRDDAVGDFVVNTGVITGGTSAQVEFMVNDTGMINLIVNGSVASDVTNIKTLDLEGVGSGIKFFCIPHEQTPTPMVGVILIAGVGGPSEVGPIYPGFALWAFWIGVIAILAMIGFIGVTYWIIKGSSSRNVDHREHVRRGLP